MMATALRLMADFLVDPDVVVIKSAQFTLRHLLATQLGQDALSQLQPVSQGYLQVKLETTLSASFCGQQIASTSTTMSANHLASWAEVQAVTMLSRR